MTISDLQTKINGYKNNNDIFLSLQKITSDTLSGYLPSSANQLSIKIDTKQENELQEQIKELQNKVENLSITNERYKSNIHSLEKEKNVLEKSLDGKYDEIDKLNEENINLNTNNINLLLENTTLKVKIQNDSNQKETNVLQIKKNDILKF